MADETATVPDGEPTERAAGQLASPAEAPTPFEAAVPDFARRMALAEAASPKREEILRVALRMFADYGYHATSLRRLADAVGIEAGSLYNHIASKSDLLARMLFFAHEELVAGIEQRIAAAPDESEVRLRVAISSHLEFHCMQREQVLVLDREYRVLTGEHAERVRRERVRYEQLFRRIIDDGIARGRFRDHDASLSVKAILRLGPGTAAWFRPDGRASAQEVGALYAALFERGLTAA